MKLRSHFRYSGNMIRLFVLAIFVASLTACNLPHATPIIPSLTPAPSNTPLVNTLTPTNTPPVPLPQNATATSTSNATGTPINLLFASGTTAIVQTGTLNAGQIQPYTINVGASQPMILILTSTKGDDYLAVYDANMNAVLDPAKKWNRWQWMLTPQVQLYTIHVIGGASTEDFTLTVKVPARIKFASGATSATVTGATVKGYVISYTVSAVAGQSLHADLSVATNSAVMDVFGLATGDVLLSTADASTTYSGTLPSTQDYIIEIVPVHGNVLNYSLTVSVQ